MEPFKFAHKLIYNYPEDCWEMEGAQRHLQSLLLHIYISYFKWIPFLPPSVRMNTLLLSRVEFCEKVQKSKVPTDNMLVSYKNVLSDETGARNRRSACLIARLCWGKPINFPQLFHKFTWRLQYLLHYHTIQTGSCILWPIYWSSYLLPTRCNLSFDRSIPLDLHICEKHATSS